MNVEKEETMESLEQKELRYRKKYYDLMMDTFDTSSFHAIPNIARNKHKPIKIMWIVCFVAAISAAAYSINNSVADYLGYSVVSTTRKIAENPITFPAITICNLNTLNFPPTNYSLELLEETLNYSQLYFIPENSNRLRYKDYRFSIISYADFAPVQKQRQMGYSLKHLMVTCIFNNRDCDLNKDFIHYFDSMFGNCYKFNYNKDKYVKQTGVQNGLQLEMYTTTAFDNMNNYSINNGWRIYISDFVDFISYNYDGVTISNGYSTNIDITKNTLVKQPNPYSSCAPGLTTIDAYPSKAYKYTFSCNRNFYTPDNCLNMCFQLLLEEPCKCYDATSGPFPGPLPVCASDEQLKCDAEIWTDFISKNYFLTLCDCPFSCDSVEFKFKTSLNEFPTKSYVDYLLTDSNFRNKFPTSKNLTYEQVRKSLSSVNIYYNEMVNKVVSEEPKKPTIALISDIGGLLSLFIGMSFLSLIEFVEVFMQSFYVFMEKHQISIKGHKPNKLILKNDNKKGYNLERKTKNSNLIVVQSLA